MAMVAEQGQEVAAEEDLETEERWLPMEEVVEIWRALWDCPAVGSCLGGVASRTFSNRWWDSRRAAVAEEEVSLEVEAVAVAEEEEQFQNENVLPRRKFGSPALPPSRMWCSGIPLAVS